LDATAFLISVAFSPYLVTVIFISIVSYLYAANLEQFLPGILIGLLFIVVIPLGYSFWLLENKKIADIHLSDHQERKFPFTVGAASSVIGAVILFIFQLPTPILAVASAYALNAVIICLITWQWKISIHSAFFTASVLIVMLLFGSKFWSLFLFWIPLAWARIHRRKHTAEQVLAGAVVAVLVTFVVFHFFGYQIGG